MTRTRECVPQRFRLSDAGKRAARGFADQLVDPFDYFFVVLLPIQAVVPSLIGKDQLHRLFCERAFGAAARAKLFDRRQ